MRVSQSVVFFVSLLFVKWVYGIDFSYLNGTATSGYTQKGAPTNLQDTSASLPTDVLNNIYSMLPEGQYVNSAFIDTTLQSNLIIDDDFTGIMTVDVTFLNEGAGYLNAFGYFIYDPNNPPNAYTEISEHVIIFPNASKPYQGEMAQGHKVPLNINLTAGQALGFFVVPNGFDYSAGYGNIKNLGPWSQPFYSLPQLNPEASNLQAHNVAFYDSVNDFFVFGFDDQHRSSGDNDFNDLLVSIEATPIYAIEGVNEDGSVDANTYQVLEQSDTEITSTTYYPSQSGMATLMFEDLWPKMGDYDFNDLVVRYRYTNTLNNRNKLTDLELSFEIQAMGANYHNGFALRLPNVPPNKIATHSLSLDGTGVISTNLLESGQADSNFILLDDVQNHVDQNCDFFRTENTCQASMTETYTLNVTFTEPIDTSVIGQPPYDPYIFGVEGAYHGTYGGRGWEVHLLAHQGTDKFLSSFIGLEDDNSTNQKHFVNHNNFPWVINIPTTWKHPQENIDILRAYPQFKTWVQSNGESAKSWYSDANAQAGHTYGE